MATFRERFARLIQERGWTQIVAAEKLGVSQALISRYIRGKREPSPRTIEYIATRLGVSLAELTGDREVAEPRGMHSPKSSVARVPPPDDPVCKVLNDLKKRWKKKPHERETIKHLVAALFPDGANQIFAWLEKE